MSDLRSRMEDEEERVPVITISDSDEVFSSSSREEVFCSSSREEVFSSSSSVEVISSSSSEEVISSSSSEEEDVQEAVTGNQSEQDVYNVYTNARKINVSIDRGSQPGAHPNILINFDQPAGVARYDVPAAPPQTGKPESQARHNWHCAATIALIPQNRAECCRYPHHGNSAYDKPETEAVQASYEARSRTPVREIYQKSPSTSKKRSRSASKERCHSQSPCHSRSKSMRKEKTPDAKKSQSIYEERTRECKSGSSSDDENLKGLQKKKKNND